MPIPLYVDFAMRIVLLRQADYSKAVQREEVLAYVPQPRGPSHPVRLQAIEGFPIISGPCTYFYLISSRRFGSLLRVLLKATSGVASDWFHCRFLYNNFERTNIRIEPSAPP